MQFKYSRLLPTPSYSYLALTSSAISILATALDRGAVNIVLPNISERFSTDIPTVQWVSVIYLLLVAVLLLPMGRLSDIVGKKKVIVAGLITFTAGGFLCSISPYFWTLLFGRLLQGVGGAMIQGTSFSIAVDSFGENQRGKSIGLVLIFVGIGNILGPAIGGTIASIAGWRSVFIFTSLITTFGVLLASITLRNESSDNGKIEGLDWIGTFFCIFMLISLLLGITMTTQTRFGFLNSYIFYVASFLFALLFIWRSLNTENPILEIRLFAKPIFALSVTANLLCFVGMGSILFLLPFYLRYVQGLDPIEVGSVFIPAAIAMSIISPISGRLSDRFGNSFFTTGGLISCAIGLSILSTLDETSPIWLPYLAVIPASAGMGAFYGPNNSATLSQANEQTQGAVIGFINLVRNSGNLISIPISVVLVTAIMESMGFKPDLSVVTNNSDPDLLKSFMKGMNTSFLVLAATTTAGAIISLYRPKS